MFWFRGLVLWVRGGSVVVRKAPSVACCELGQDAPRSTSATTGRREAARFGPTRPRCRAPDTPGGCYHSVCVGRAIILCAAALLLGSGCGFQKTAPVSNVCGLLSLPDVQSLAPGLTTATEQVPEDSPDLWKRICQFSGPGVVAHVGVGVSGALTPQGDQQLADDVSGAPLPEVLVIVVNGLGDRAVYTNNHYFGTSGLVAKQGGYEIGVGIVNGAASIGQLEPLVRTVLGRLP
jgi:hypothetical protein